MENGKQVQEKDKNSNIFKQKSTSTLENGKPMAFREQRDCAVIGFNLF